MSVARSSERSDGRVVALCGGVGGAKLSLGLQEVLGNKLAVLVNVADDFEHLGLSISPDIDTVLYTLSGQNDEKRGWGRADETWNAMAALAQIGGEVWFSLGDRDLALHIERTRRLKTGERLTLVVADISRRFGIRAAILPITDDAVRTIVTTPQGRMPFQRYFVEHRCEPVLTGIEVEGASAARMTDDVVRALQPEGLRMIVICPSNPYLSIDPILAVPEVREAVRRARVPVVAVSPIIGGRAIKGPTTKIMQELGFPTTTAAIAAHYHGLIDGLVIDQGDYAQSSIGDIAICAAPTLMTDLASKVALARAVLAFGDRLVHVSSAGDRARDTTQDMCR